MSHKVCKAQSHMPPRKHQYLLATREVNCEERSTIKMVKSKFSKSLKEVLLFVQKKNTNSLV